MGKKCNWKSQKRQERGIKTGPEGKRKRWEEG